MNAAGASHRSFSPNGDGHGDTLRVDWTDATTLTGLTLNIFRHDGSLAGTVAVGTRGAGAQSYLWNGRIGSTSLPSGTYVVQLVGRDGSGAHHAPTTMAVGALQLQLYGVALHQVGVERLAGADRYATAAAISRATAQPGVAAVVIASGASFPDGLGASPAAAALHGPLLLVQPQAIPAVTAAGPASGGSGRVPRAQPTDSFR